MTTNQRHRRWSHLFLVAGALVVGLPTIASADVCPAEATEERFGPFEASRVNEWYDTPITTSHPCEELQVEFSVTSATAATFHVDLIGGTGIPFRNDHGFRCQGICTFMVPPADELENVVGAGWMSTAGEAGRIKAVSVMVTDMAATLGPAPLYRLTIHKLPRPGFNIGGVGFG